MVMAKNSLNKKSGVVRPLGLQWDPYMDAHYPEPTMRGSSVSTDIPSKEPAMHLDDDEDSMEPPNMSITPERLLTPRRPALHIAVPLNLTNSQALSALLLRARALSLHGDRARYESQSL